MQPQGFRDLVHAAWASWTGRKKETDLFIVVESRRRTIDLTLEKGDFAGRQYCNLDEALVLVEEGKASPSPLFADTILQVVGQKGQAAPAVGKAPPASAIPQPVRSPVRTRKRTDPVKRPVPKEYGHLVTTLEEATRFVLQDGDSVWAFKKGVPEPAGGEIRLVALTEFADMDLGKPSRNGDIRLSYLPLYTLKTPATYFRGKNDTEMMKGQALQAAWWLADARETFGPNNIPMDRTWGNPGFSFQKVLADRMREILHIARSRITSAKYKSVARVPVQGTTAPAESQKISAGASHFPATDLHLARTKNAGEIVHQRTTGPVEGTALALSAGTPAPVKTGQAALVQPLAGPVAAPGPREGPVPAVKMLSVPPGYSVMPYVEAAAFALRVADGSLGLVWTIDSKNLEKVLKNHTRGKLGFVIRGIQPAAVVSFDGLLPDAANNERLIRLAGLTTGQLEALLAVFPRRKSPGAEFDSWCILKAAYFLCLARDRFGPDNIPDIQAECRDLRGRNFYLCYGDKLKRIMLSAQRLERNSGQKTAVRSLIA
ncbi:MAG: hypothetical protein M3O22_04575 [Pseudomonadota bacterium]|nr:hypothetical protein [Pseudomonadota bacterium]